MTVPARLPIWPAIMAIDPGPTHSAWLVTDPQDAIRSFARWPNDELLALLRGNLHGGLSPDVQVIVIEKVEGFGMAVGAEVFETVYWSGRFAEAVHPRAVDRIGRRAVKLHLCGQARAKDPNIRQALIDRYGPGKDVAIGTKRQAGPLYGISGDVWSALAVAVTWTDLHR
jgi:hypothetical protein